jgi:hypothetical protein
MGKLCGTFAVLVLAMVFAGAAAAQGRSGEAHEHVIICHRTGSESNPYVVINIASTAWNEAHDPASSHAHPPLNGRTDIFLAVASGPGTKDGFTADDCEGGGGVSPGDGNGDGDDGDGNGDAGISPGGDDGDGGTTGVATTGGALGVAGAGGAGAQAGELPFTGLPAWIPALAAVALLTAGFALLRRRAPTDT